MSVKDFVRKQTVIVSSLMALVLSQISFQAAGVADELDRNGSGKIPSAIIVKKNIKNNSVEIYKAPGLPRVDSAKTSALANEAYLKASNKIDQVAKQSELDRSSSVDSWYYYPCSGYSPYYPYYGSGGYPSYYYSYYYYGSSYNYYPYYGYNYGNYSYYYYYYNYGYNNYGWY